MAASLARMIKKPRSTKHYDSQKPPELSTPLTVEEPLKETKTRNLSPSDLGSLLRAELTHLINIETRISELAEVEAAVEAAQFEQQVVHDMELEDNTEEIEELERLDAEIERLESLLKSKQR